MLRLRSFLGLTAGFRVTKADGAAGGGGGGREDNDERVSLCSLLLSFRKDGES